MNSCEDIGKLSIQNLLKFFLHLKSWKISKDDTLADWCSTIALLHLQISSENETFNLLATGNIMLPWLACCKDQPLVRVAPKRYLASLAARWFPPGTRVCGGNQIGRIFLMFFEFLNCCICFSTCFSQKNNSWSENNHGGYESITIALINYTPGN